MAGRYVSGDNKSDELASPNIVRPFQSIQQMYICQEFVASMKQTDIEKAMAIVNVFETGKPRGNYATLAVLNDGAGISYGIKQFTHRSGSLLQVVEKYLSTGTTAGRETIESRLPILCRSTKLAIDTLASDERFKQALKSAAATPEMRASQDSIAFERYMKPAVDECRALGLTLPLSLAVVYDSMVHGSWPKLSAQIGPVRDEKVWIKRYVETRHEWLRSIGRLRTTSYRTSFFLKEIARGNWQLKLPMYVHGYLLKASDFPEAATPQPPAEALPDTQPGPGPKSRDAQVAAPTTPRVAESDGHRDAAKAIDSLEDRVKEIAARVDQAERIVVTTATRTDKAKSLWATIAGTMWQMLWAIGGFFAGVPREVWLVVAIIAGLLAALFIYRQITLGKMRERNGRNPTGIEGAP
jgi:chitosanase